MREYRVVAREQELLTTPQSIFSRIIADVQRARRSVDLEFYIFEADNVGRAFTELLARKARQGVKVRVLLDGFGSRGVAGDIRRRLLRCGVEVLMSERIANRRNHRKMVVIDRCVAYLGGINIADRYVAGNALGIWHDAVLRLEGAVAMGVVQAFECDYCRFRGEAVRCDITAGVGVALHLSEASGGGAMESLLTDIASEAQREVIITTPYLFPTRRMLSILGGAVARGVRVRILLPERCDVWTLDSLMPIFIDEALAVGIEVEVVVDAFLHAKMAIVDGRRVVVGSANLDARSLYINREMMASTRDRGVCQAAKGFVDRVALRASPAVRGGGGRPVARIFAHLLRDIL